MGNDTRKGWTLRSVSGRPLVVNEVARMHRHTWATRTRLDRGEWWALAVEAHMPRLTAVEVHATPLHKDRRSPQDVAACAPAVKAAIDGLRDAGVLADDTADIVRLIVFHPPSVCGVDGLELRIEQVA